MDKLRMMFLSIELIEMKLKGTIERSERGGSSSDFPESRNDTVSP